MHEGYAGTMGGAQHTAHITDRYSSPPDFASHYVEKLLYLPHAFFVNDHRQTYPELLHDVVVEVYIYVFIYIYIYIYIYVYI